MVRAPVYLPLAVRPSPISGPAEIRNLKSRPWGAGVWIMSDWEKPEIGVRGSESLDPDQLAGLSAADAIALLSPGSDAGKLDLDAPEFPGPIAEAAYWDDGSVVGIQGPVQLAPR